jgi:mRNA interferase RelE/StbE
VTWNVIYTRTFLKELAKLPDEIRKRVEAVAFEEEIRRNPFLSGKAQKLVGHPSYYKIRLGEYRVGIHVDPDTQTIGLPPN